MKQFQVELRDIEKVNDTYQVAGRSVGDEPIALGDYLNGMEIVKIEAYGRELVDCPPGLTAALTLSFSHRDRTTTLPDYFLLTLTEEPPYPGIAPQSQETNR